VSESSLEGAPEAIVRESGKFMTFQYQLKHEREHLPIREVVGDPR